MEKEMSFRKSLVRIALPVTLQSLLQSSFSVIDQVMIGQLGEDSIAGIGLGGKFASIYSVVLGAVAAAAGIMIAQYLGQKNEKSVSRSFYVNLLLAMGIGLLFLLVSLVLPQTVMSLYTKEAVTRELAAEYLSIFAWSFLPMALSTMAAVMLRCMDAAVYPLAASFLSVILNTGLNYVLIFGRMGLPQLGVRGAAIASVIAQVAACIVTLVLLLVQLQKRQYKMSFFCRFAHAERMQYLGILAPILVCEFMWSLGENVYAAIYGNIGTDACAAMTMTGPIQGLMIGALSGLAQAAGILIGKSLGNEEYDKAYKDSKRLMWYGLAGSLVLSVALVLLGQFYVRIYNVEPQVRTMAYQLLVVFAIVSPVKVQNMILGGGIIRSGGKTQYVMWVDLIGTWIFGVPLGLLSAFVFDLPITYVYFILSMEEVVRLLISVVIFRKKRWMRTLE